MGLPPVPPHFLAADGGPCGPTFAGEGDGYARAASGLMESMPKASPTAL